MKEMKIRFNDSVLKEMERMRISIGSDNYAELIRKGLLLLNAVIKEKHKGFDKIIVENSYTGKQLELINFLE